MPKDQRFYVRVSDEDRSMLVKVSDAMGVQPSQAIRVLVREKYREIFGAEPATKARRSKAQR